MDKYAPPQHRLIDADTAALALGVSAPTVRRLIGSGELTNYGKDRKFLVDVLEVMQLADTRNGRT